MSYPPPLRSTWDTRATGRLKGVRCAEGRAVVIGRHSLTSAARLREQLHPTRWLALLGAHAAREVYEVAGLHVNPRLRRGIHLLARPELLRPRHERSPHPDGAGGPQIALVCRHHHHPFRRQAQQRGRARIDRRVGLIAPE